MTSVPSIQFLPQGLVLPSEPDILSGVQDDLNTAFGGNLNPSLETPQGQIATTQAAIIAEKNSQLAYLSNQSDPTYASGRFQDAIGKLYNLTRKPAISTTTTVTCTGAQGVVIPAGAKCIDSLGNIYLNTASVTIPVSGSVVAAFAAQEAGPIALSSNDLTIYQSILGWDSVTNTAGVVGSYVESRADFEFRRQASLSANAINTLASISGSVFSVDGVTDVYVLENNLGTNVTNGAITVLAHSIYVCAYGGTDPAVAQAIWEKKAPGANYTGNTTVQVTDTSLYQYPYPTYDVKFQRPVALPIKFLVQLQNNANLPGNITALVKAAIVSAFYGNDGGQRARIGSTIIAGRFYAGVAATSQFANVLALFVDTGGGTPAATSVVVGIDKVPTLTETDITVSLI